MRYAVGGRATGGGAGESLAALWNPHATQMLRVTYIAIAENSITAPQSVTLRRTTTRGTPASTITPDADNAYDFRSAPPSGALLDLGDFTVAPTLAAAVLWRWTASAAQGCGAEDRFPCLCVPAGTGLALVDAAALAWTSASDLTFTWEE